MIAANDKVLEDSIWDMPRELLDWLLGASNESVLSRIPSQHGVSTPVGTANSLACHVSFQQRKVDLLYKADFDLTSKPDRFGRLHILSCGNDVLSGHWVSDFKDQKHPNGLLIAAKKDNFDAVLEKYTSLNIE